MRVSPPDYSTYFRPDAGHRHTGAAGDAPVLDHGIMTGLSDDDHSQYYNDARLNPKFDDTTGHAHTGVAGQGARIQHHDLLGLIDDDHTQYTLDTEFNAKFDASTGHKHTGAAGDAPKIDADTLDGSHKVDLTKISAMSVLLVSASVTSTRVHQTINLETYSAAHKFFAISGYETTINRNVYYHNGSIGSSDIAMFIARNYGDSGYENLRILMPEDTSRTVEYKVYKYNE